MDHLDSISEIIRAQFDNRTAVRDQALSQARALTRFCSQAIRAVHRDDDPAMLEQLAEARKLADSLRSVVVEFPDLYFAGYTQDALKEYVEANVTCALIKKQPL